MAEAELRTQIEHLHEKVVGQEQMIFKLLDERTEVLKANSACQSWKDQADAATEQAKDAQAEIAESKLKITALQASLERTNNEALDLREALLRTENELRTLEQIRREEAEATTAEEKFEIVRLEMLATINALRAEIYDLKESRSMLSSQLAEANAMVGLKATAAAEAKADSDKARGTTLAALQKVSILEKALEKANQVIAEQGSNMAELQSRAASAAAAEQEALHARADAMDSVDAIKEQREEAQRTRSVLRDELRAAEEAAEEARLLAKHQAIDISQLQQERRQLLIALKSLSQSKLSKLKNRPVSALPPGPVGAKMRQRMRTPMNIPSASYDGVGLPPGIRAARVHGHHKLNYGQ